MARLALPLLPGEVPDDVEVIGLADPNDLAPELGVERDDPVVLRLGGELPEEGANGVVDCRPAADTNHDNKLDENDTCVPTGGFINSLRAVNAAKAIITKATKGSTGKKSTTPTTTVPTPTTIPDVEDTEVDDT